MEHTTLNTKPKIIETPEIETEISITQIKESDKKSKPLESQKENCCLNNNSLIPIIKEIERFTLYMNNKFNLNIPQDVIITINKSHPNTLGHYAPKGFMNTKTDLKQINLNTYHLKRDNGEIKNAYVTLAHEIAHLINDINQIQDCSVNQYHNKHFKKQAEKLLLLVSRTNKGYSQTEPSPEFIEMLKDFKAQPEVFNIAERLRAKPTKTPSRLLLFVCGCGCKIRTAKNQDKPLKAICQYCNTEFKEIEKK